MAIAARGSELFASSGQAQVLVAGSSGSATTEIEVLSERLDTGTGLVTKSFLPPHRNVNPLGGGNMAVSGPDLFQADTTLRPTIDEFNISTGALVRMLPVGQIPEFLAVGGPDLFVSNGSAETYISVFNIATGKHKDLIPPVPLSAPMAVRWPYLYASDGQGGVEAYNVSTGALGRHFDGANTVGNLALSGSYLFASVATGGTHGWSAQVLESDIATGQLVKVLQAPSGFPLALIASGNTLVLAESSATAATTGGLVCGFDTLTGKISWVLKAHFDLVDMPRNWVRLALSGSDVLVDNAWYTTGHVPYGSITEVNAKTGAQVRVISGARTAPMATTSARSDP